MNRAKAVHYIVSTFVAIDTVIESRGTTALNTLWRELQRECRDQERQHRASRHGEKRCSLMVATQYFAAMACCRDVPEIRTWFTAMDIRRDWALGYAIGESLAALGLWSEVIKRGALVRELSMVDYATDLMGAK